MLRHLVGVVVLAASVAAAQGTPDIPEPKVIVVPYPGAQVDAGTATTTVVEVPEPPPQPQPEPVQPTEPLPTRTLEAQPPPPPPPEQLDLNPKQLDQGGPGAMIDGHPREGAFLSGPGSLTFLLHHSLQLGLGVLTTQMLPRIIDSYCMNGVAGCMNNPEIWTNQDARIAYLAGTFIGAGIGFGAAAFWQFNHWISHSTANFGIAFSFIGGMFLGGIGDLIKHDATLVSWMAVLGNTIGAWLTAIVGGGDLAVNKGTLIASGAGWAMIYTALILGIVASTGGGSSMRAGIDALMITPAIGAGAMALATLKFNPSFAQIMRANVFGAGAGGVVLLVSALLLGFANPVPYILGAVAAIGAKTIVSLLWADAAENPPPAMPPPQPGQTMLAPASRPSRITWW